MGTPGKRTRPGDEDGGDLETLMAVERSPAFDRALARLLAAHHAGLSEARCGRSAEAEPSSLQAPWEAAARHGAERKGADEPVGPQMGFEGEHEEVFMADSCCADGLVGAHSGRVSEDSDETGQASLSMNKIIDVIQSTHHIARHGCLIDFVGGVKFEVGSAIVLLMFCVVTAFEMQGEGMSLGYELRYSRYEDPAGSGWPEATITLQILSICFGGIFALEVLIRVLAARKQFVFEWWNIFDLIQSLRVGLWSSLALSLIPRSCG
ncbi:unnamed protein product [Prorocentrum cordatum]|uniref:Ion transport domain-containing protein n=1 Tax=Prorocentrum cordatum TaxID=2364126 RepID=A0ABN9U337_9DINO|nr:unnamed protein product [Polarella glacialis]